MMFGTDEKSEKQNEKQKEKKDKIKIALVNVVCNCNHHLARHDWHVCAQRQVRRVTRRQTTTVCARRKSENEYTPNETRKKQLCTNKIKKQKSIYKTNHNKNHFKRTVIAKTKRRVLIVSS